MSEGHVDIGTGRLWVTDEGDGPALVFLHGFSFDRRQWAPQVAAFSGRHRCIAHDLRGFGRSAPPDEAYDHVLDLHALIETLELEAPVLVGLSLGANVAMAYAARYPEIPSRLVLISSGLPGFEWEEERPPDAAKAHADAHGAMATKDFWLGHPLFASLDDYPEASAAAHQMVADYSGWHWENPDPRFVSPPGQDPDAIACRTLVVSGGRDVKGYQDISTKLAATIRNAELVTFGEAGHMLTLERPDSFNELLANFLATEEAMS